ncbi:hypothetical protein DAT35_48380 [Vitiosangium sp. GDMCC 1.1324]|nr:hypothetical protein DAT35_48380 [Vitiosangium sp. GDMCC 1.1324]
MASWWPRDGLIICFFMRRSHGEVAPAVWRALQTFLRAIPPQALSWYVASKGGFLHEERSNWFFFLKQDPEDMRRWIRRFCS